ncbi:MAG: hypothetical protein SF097_14310 [Acidobacteriota bacterium]|nr:hypothetical protein [Acidobacteriota bacterium]
MRKTISTLFLLAAMTGAIFAQDNSTTASSAQSSQSSGQSSAKSGSERRGYGYVFAAPGVVASEYGSSATWQFGVGGEGLLKGGFGVGGEIGGLAPAQSFSEGFGVFSAGANYHFLKASKSGKVAPFVNGGYTMFFRNGVTNGGHFGGGANYWFKERVGLRFEVRDQVVSAFGNTHFVGFRFGLTFR